MPEKQTMIAKCPCQHCNGRVEFNVEDAGRAIECPHCHMQTELFIAPPEKPMFRVAPYVPSGSKPNIVACGYFLAVLLPFVGFFFGIYLMTKKESGHGLTCIGISIVASVIWMELLASM